MTNQYQITTARIEAFSDGVIAIIITVMIFDLKLHEVSDSRTFFEEFVIMVPKFLSYAFSFLMLSIMWVNHHQLFHQIKYADGKVLWYSLHHLFWMSFVPFATNLIGSNPLLWVAAAVYGVTFCMCALSFTLLRNHALTADLFHHQIDVSTHKRILDRNKLAIAMYLLASVTGIISNYISFVLFLIVPTFYFIPQRIANLKT